jgi:hypothetical protein
MPNLCRCRAIWKAFGPCREFFPLTLYKNSNMTFANWNELCLHLGKQFNIDIDLNGVLFLVGIRERGLTLQPFTKDEKMSLINLGSCTLYQEMGLVEKTGTDEEGWPVFRQKALAPSIPEDRKNKVLQDCALRYFGKIL